LIFFFGKKSKLHRNRVKPTGFSSVWFFRAKTGSNRFGLVFLILARFSWFWLGFLRFWLGFFGLSQFFWFGSVFFGLARFFSILVQFGVFGFLLIKPKTNWTSRFFQNFNWFNRFFQLFFSGFLSLIGFLVFLLTPSTIDG
jgi:hypothetical protein